MPSSARCLRLAIGLVLLASLRGDLLAAQSAETGERFATRQELQRAADSLSAFANSPAYGARLRARTAAQLASVRRRLASGDFAVGQRIAVRVDGQTMIFNDTVTVADSVMLILPGIRRIPLHGILRAELEPHLRTEVSEVVREARVIANPLMRVAVLGDVARPGFVAVPAETLLDQLLTRSGGPGATANVEHMKLVRGDTTLLQGASVIRAIADGLTLDQLDLRDGDALIVPRGSPPFDRSSAIQLASMILAPLLTAVLLR